jgi:hypothetical protein
VLHVDSALTLHIAGHVLPLGDVLAWADSGMTVERRALVRCVDNPVAAAGAKESAEKRRARVDARRKELIESGVRNYNQVLAQEEGVTTVSRIKQILKPKIKEPLQNAKDFGQPARPTATRFPKGEEKPALTRSCTASAG